jgi:eukaryotic-like serine/threonine-protein kinase
VAEAIEYAMQACEGLCEVHSAGIVHRDLKPANLFLARRSDGSVRVKLLDFGISKVSALPGGASDGGMTSTQALMGSPLYMAPEQMRSSKAVDARADIWSLGVILYEMLGGRSPFNGDTLPMVCARIMAEAPDPLRELRREVPAGLEGVVMRCLEKEAARRYQDVAALAQALAPFGQPEARAAADRIGRVMRGTLASAVDLRAEAVATTTTNQRPEIAQTAAAFGTASTNTVRRPPALPFVAGGALLVVAGIVAMIVTRAPDTPKGAAAQASAPPSALAPTPPSAPTPTPAPTPPSASASVLAPTETPPASTPAPLHPHGKPKAVAAPAVSTAKPAATSGFGGRD